MVDPSGDAATIQRGARRRRRALRGDPRHARPLRPHRQPRRPGRADRRAGVRARRRADPDRGARRVHAARDHRARRRSRTSGSTEARRSTQPGSRSPSPASPATRPGTSPTSRTASCSRATSSSPARSGAPIFPGGDWDTLAGVDRVAPRRLPAGDDRPPGPRPRDDARGRAGAEPVPRRPPRRPDAAMSGKIERPRGTHDVVPAEMPLWQRVTGEVERLCALYGYRKVLTPVFEDTALFARTSGQGSDVVQKEMYSFTDRSDRPLTLRPEGTAPICRAYVEHGMHRDPQPAKLFTIAPMYRYGAPGKGRYREHWQASVEAIGSDDPSIDAELLQLYDTLLHRLGVSAYHLELNSIGCRTCRPAYLETLARLARDERAPPRRRHAREGRDEPAARLRQLPRQARRGPRGPRRGAEDRRVALRGVRRALRRRAGRPRRHRRRLHARPDPRARPRLLHADDVGVHRPDGQRELDDLRRRPLRRPRRGDRRAAHPGRRLRRRARAAADRDGGRRRHRRPAHDRRLLRARGRSAAAARGALARRAARGRASRPTPTTRGARSRGS